MHSQPNWTDLHFSVVITILKTVRLHLRVLQDQSIVWKANYMFTIQYKLYRRITVALLEERWIWDRMVAMENVNTIDERRSKIVRNRVFDCELSPD